MPAMTASTQGITLTANSERQLSPKGSMSMRTPARMGPPMPATIIIGPNRPKALAACSPGNRERIMPMPCGSMSAPSRPWSTRPRISTPATGAHAESSEPSVKPTMPIRNSRRLPNMSPRRPPISRPEAIESV
jgi:hypothetical protein